MRIRITIKVNPKTYLRDPAETELGRKIIKHGIDLLSETGFHCFKFKQLAKAMDSTEASVYRYFENKHFLLVYLTSWYWDYLDYLIMINTRNITDPRQRLKIAIKTMVEGSTEASPVEYIDQKKLHKIVVEQSTKVFHNRKVEENDKCGLFKNFTNLNNNIAAIIQACNPEFKYPHSLATNILKLAIDHTYYAEHMCAITEITNCMVTKKVQLEEMINYFVDRLLK